MLNCLPIVQGEFMEFVVLLALIVLNGVFAMSEIALVTARKGRLSKMAEEGSTGAAAALQPAWLV